MPNKEEVDKAIAALNGNDFKGRTLTVIEARPRTDKPRTVGGGLRPQPGEQPRPPNSPAPRA